MGEKRNQSAEIKDKKKVGPLKVEANGQKNAMIIPLT